MSNALTKQAPSAWHRGEKALHEKVGVADRMETIGRRVIRDYMPDQHREFFPQLPFVVLGSVDRAGDPWATLLVGRPGFITSPTARSLEIDARASVGDPAGEGMQDGDAVGLLGIELHTRRRNRENGVLRVADGTSPLRFELEQSFGNCPQYIQLRDVQFVRDPAEPFAEVVEKLATLDGRARDMIQAADTFFVASYVDRGDHRQVDVSHRGGRAGFVRVGDGDVLTVPDFAGNLFFATLGNILLNGKAGLLFVDFATGDVLQLTGDAEVILDSPEIAAFQGAERLMRFRPRRVVRRAGALALRGSFQKNGWSPNSLMTGSWAQAADRLRASERASGWRPFRVTKIVNESRSVRSFHLQPDDAAGLVAHRAGQHLPIRLSLPGIEKPLIRTYTLSVAPSDGIYRISVKRDGAVSRFLHEQVSLGDVIEARAPTGAFTIDAREKRPAVLLAGGIGITPLLAMLRHVVYEGLRTRVIRPTVLFYAAHSKWDRPFDKEIAELVAAARGAVRVIRVLSDTEGAEEGADYDVAGRIDVALLTRFLPFDDFDFYVCGPSGFTQELYDGLRRHHVPDSRIHAEAFGPSALVRTDALGSSRPAPATDPVPVVFTRSLKEARWTPESGTLLELAESRGLDPEYSCRMGTCGTCKTPLLSGAVTYVKEPAASVDEGEVLICCAVPARPATAGPADRIELAL